MSAIFHKKAVHVACFGAWAAMLLLGGISGRIFPPEQGQLAISLPWTASLAAPKSNTTWGWSSGDDTIEAAVCFGEHIYVTGYSAGGPGGAYDAYLAVFDNQSELVALDWWGGSGTDEGKGIGVDAAGNVYIMGHTNSYGFVGNEQFIFLKYTSEGILVWNRTWGTRIGNL